MKRYPGLIRTRDRIGTSDRLGMTLVEIIVSMGVMVVVLGLVFGIAIQSDKATRKQQKRQQGMQYAELVIQEISETIRRAIVPADLAAEQDLAAVTPKFTAQELALPVIDVGDQSALCLVTIAPGKNPNDERTTIERSIDPVANAAGGRPVTKSAAPIGTILPEEYTPSVQFGYANVERPERMEAFQDQWPSDQWPDLIQITVTVSANDEQTRPIVLQTAVIPGLMPARALAGADLSAVASAKAEPTTQTTPVATPEIQEAMPEPVDEPPIDVAEPTLATQEEQP